MCQIYSVVTYKTFFRSEQYIYQKQVGAHYTSEDICRYIAVNTIVPFIFDSVEKQCPVAFAPGGSNWRLLSDRDRKSTRLNSSHANISYAGIVFTTKIQV